MSREQDSIASIRWFGDAPNGWVVERLKRVTASITSGVSVNASDSPAEEHQQGVLKTSAVGGGKFFPEENKTVWESEVDRLTCPVTGDSVIMSRMNTPALVGESGYIPESIPNLFLPDRLWKLSFDKERVFTPFLASVLSSSGARQALSCMATGTSPSMKNLSMDEMGSLPIPLPPIVEQKAIASYLQHDTARIDGLIAEKVRMLALLEEKRAALTCRVVTRGLDPNVFLKPSGQEWLGEIPAHWELWRLKHLASEALSYGANEAALEDNPQWPRFVRITDIATDGSLRDETFKSLSPEIAETFLLDDGDLLFARSGATVGKSFIYRPSWGTACFAGYLIRFKSDLSKVLPDFLNLYAQSSPYWHQVSTGMIQATIQNFSAEKYADIIVPLPPMKTQREIVDVMAKEQARFDGLTSQISNSLTLMKERRAVLITAAVTGQIPLEEMQP